MSRSQTTLIVLVLLAGALVFAGCSDSGLPVATLVVKDQYARPANTDVVAFQDGDGPWIALRPSSTGLYQHVVTNPSHRYSFAAADVFGDQSNYVNIIFYHATTDEITTFPLSISSNEMLYVEGSGSMEGVSSSESAIVASNRYITFASDPTEYKMVYRDGKQSDMFAGRYETSTFSTTIVPNRFVLLRDITLTNPLPDIDFTNNGFDPERYAVTVDGTVQDASVNLWTAGGGQLPVGSNQGVGGNFEYAALPAARTAAGDLYEIGVSNSPWRTMKNVAFHTPSDLSLSLSDVPPFGSITAQGTTISWDAYPGVSLYELWCQSAGDPSFRYDIAITPGWLRGTSYTLPTMTGIDGWQAAWTPAALSSANAMAVTCNKSVTGFVGHSSDGLEITMAWNSADTKYKLLPQNLNDITRLFRGR